VTLTPRGSPKDYQAAIRIVDGKCAFLEDQLCSIQARFGEEHLPKVCATYPRTTNVVDGVPERWLRTSCPEAVRRVLLDPAPLALEECELPEPVSLSRGSHVNTAGITGGKPYVYFHAARDRAAALLQDRSRRFWERMAALGCLCDRLDGMVQQGSSREFGEALEAEPVRIAAPPQALAFQLEVMFSLLVERLGQYTAPVFRECYAELMKGLAWTAEDSFEDLARRFAGAYSQFCEPFLAAREYLLENLLVNYVYRTMFPFGPQRTDLMAEPVAMQGSIADKFRLMAAHTAIVQTLLTGAAACRRDEFGEADIVRVVYSFCRSFEHSLTFPTRALEILSANGVTDARTAAALVRVGQV
jgi:lysine-N-methylase